MERKALLTKLTGLWGVRLMIHAMINSNPPLPPTPILNRVNDLQFLTTPILSHITPAPYLTIVHSLITGPWKLKS